MTGISAYAVTFISAVCTSVGRIGDPPLMMVNDVPLSRLHFTRYNMSAPWRLCLANNCLCPKQVKWHVSEDGSPTSDLYILPRLNGSHVQVGAMLWFSGGSSVLSVPACVHPGWNPALVIRLSEAAEWEQRWRAFITPTTFWTTAASAGRSVCTTLKWTHSSGGCPRLELRALRMYARWLRSVICNCSCPTTNSVSDRIVHGCFLISFLIHLWKIESCQKVFRPSRFSIPNLLSVIYS